MGAGRAGGDGVVADRWNVRRLAMRASEDVATRRFVQGKCTPIYFHGMPMLRVTALFEGVVEKVTHTVGPLAITQHAYLHRAPAARASVSYTHLRAHET